MNVILYCLKSIFFAILVAYISLIGTLIGQSVALFMGLGRPNQTTFIESISGIIPFFLVTTFIAIVVGEMFKKLEQSSLERFVCIFFYHYFFFYGLKMLDKIFSGNDFSLAYELISQIVPALIFAFLVTILWKPEKIGEPFIYQLKNYLINCKFKRWWLRFIIGSVIFVVIFYFTNWLIAPFLQQYNTTLTHHIPNGVLVKFLAGVLYALTILPIFIRWKETKTSILYWIGFPIFLQIAVYPAVVEFWLPMGLRFPYLIQYTVISFLLAIFYVGLFYVPKESEVIDDQFKWMY
jgi:hypothetical protein